MDINRLRHLAGQAPINEMGPEEVDAKVQEAIDALHNADAKLQEIADLIAIDEDDVYEFHTYISNLIDEIDDL